MLTNNGREIRIDVDSEMYRQLEVLATKASVTVEYFCKTILQVCVEDNLLDGIMDFNLDE